MSRVVVLGGGESGCGAAILAHTKGEQVWLSDRGNLTPEYRALLEKWSIPFEEGHHSEELILSADIVIKSPGIPDTVALVQRLRAQGVPVISEIEYAARYSTSRTICVTGSNGKTTTTTLIYEMLRQGGVNVGLGGNIGQSYALSVATQQHDWYVLELSSFQLDGMFDFRADVGVLLNITPDHLDRYDYQLQNYVNSKFRIIQNQRPTDCFIYCADDPLTMSNLSQHGLRMQTAPFSVKGGGGCAGTLREGMLHVEMDGARVDLNTNDLQIKGTHNTYNAMAASLAALRAGVEPSSIARTLRTFTGVEHRLEPCGEVEGVLYVNDSKATNVDSVWYALQSMTRPVVWIAGGTDKGNDYGQLFELVADKVKTLICMGVDNTKLLEVFGPRIAQVVDTHSLDAAMKAAREAAQAGDVVLLSPACASFDLFRNYEDRGRQFKQHLPTPQ